MIIMGDGFSKTQFGEGGNYEQIMQKAYDDLFSVEPYASLQDYFNVYYIKAVSDEDHDTTPQLNGAIQGDANTVFSTQFKRGSTSITGDDDAVLLYAQQAIRYKGGKGGTSATDFKSSLNEFIAFDNTLTIDMSSSAMTRSSDTEGLLPLAPPVLKEVE